MACHKADISVGYIVVCNSKKVFDMPERANKITSYVGRWEEALQSIHTDAKIFCVNSVPDESVQVPENTIMDTRIFKHVSPDALDEEHGVIAISFPTPPQLVDESSEKKRMLAQQLTRLFLAQDMSGWMWYRALENDDPHITVMGVSLGFVQRNFVMNPVAQNPDAFWEAEITPEFCEAVANSIMDTAPFFEVTQFLTQVSVCIPEVSFDNQENWFATSDVSYEYSRQPDAGQIVKQLDAGQHLDYMPLHAQIRLRIPCGSARIADQYLAADAMNNLLEPYGLNHFTLDEQESTASHIALIADATELMRGWDDKNMEIQGFSDESIAEIATHVQKATGALDDVWDTW